MGEPITCSNVFEIPADESHSNVSNCGVPQGSDFIYSFMLGDVTKACWQI